MKHFLCSILIGAALSASAQTSPALNGLEGRIADEEPFTRKIITPARLIALPDSLTTGTTNPQALLNPFDGQLTTSSRDVCRLSTADGKHGAVLLDFGKEIYGGLEIAAPIRKSQKAVKVRIRYGESVSEAMSDVNAPGSTATNDHSLRDFVIEVPWLGTVTTPNSGFRFARIDLVDDDAQLPIKSVRAVMRYRDLPWVGSFKCDDERLNRIWETGAYTVQLNMQDYLWDGVKRDRLVWVGDMHPEVMTIASVFGDYDTVKKSLDFARDNSPLPGWMNSIAAYSMWWVLIHHDLYMHSGDLDYLKEQTEYMDRLFTLLADGIADDGSEDLKGGQRLLDWPTSDRPEVIHSGYHSLMVMTMEAGKKIGEWTGNKEMTGKCDAALKRLKNHHPGSHDNKQAAAMLVLGDQSKNVADDCAIIAEGGADGFSTFFGYYMLNALAEGGRQADALKIISDYWGAMLDLGATTFWEDLTYGEALKASRIDEPVAEGDFDIHAQSGNYCYKGHRHSFCHGWASGPTSWLSRNVLGVKPLEPGCRVIEVKPSLGHLQWAEGSFPTPYGPVKVSHRRQPDGSIESSIEAPDGVTVIR